MRTAWNVVSVLALAHLLALGGFVGFLVGTDRLDDERIDRIREMLAEPVPEEEARLEAERAEAEAASAGEAEASMARVLPLGSEQSLDIKLELSDADRERSLRADRQVADLRRRLEADQARLDDAIARFEEERKAFEAWRAEIAATEGDAQFRKALAVYEGLKADQAASALRTLLADGDRDQVVSYLGAMEERKRTKVIQVIVEDDPRLAAELLESLRRHGVDAPVAQGEIP